MDRESALMRVAEVASLLGVSSGRVYQLIAQARLPATRCGRSIRIPRAAWEQWLVAQRDAALAATRQADGTTED